MKKNKIGFTQNLPTKKCVICGETIVEQPKCYRHKCDVCSIL